VFWNQLAAATGAAEVTALAEPPALSARPNPARAGTSISYRLAESGRVRLAVYDVTGRVVRVLADGLAAAGVHAATWNGRGAAGESLPSGVYFVALEGSGTATVPIVLLR
jgi:hypothetical protein